MNEVKMNIVLISCVSRKLDGEHPAIDLYQGPLFKGSVKYAQTFNPTKMFILSAKHFLLESNKVISKYDLTLNNMSKVEKALWATTVINQLKELGDLDKFNFIILAGKNYYSGLIPFMKHYELPLEGLRLGERISWLQKV